MLYAILPISGTEKYVTEGSRLHVMLREHEVLSLHKLPAKLIVFEDQVLQGGSVLMQILSYKKVRDGYAFKKIRRHVYQRKLGIRRILAEIQIKEIQKS